MELILCHFNTFKTHCTQNMFLTLVIIITTSSNLKIKLSELIISESTKGQINVIQLKFLQKLLVQIESPWSTKSRKNILLER